MQTLNALPDFVVHFSVFLSRSFASASAFGIVVLN